MLSHMPISAPSAGARNDAASLQPGIASTVADGLDGCCFRTRQRLQGCRYGAGPLRRWLWLPGRARQLFFAEEFDWIESYATGGPAIPARGVGTDARRRSWPDVLS